MKVYTVTNTQGKIESHFVICHNPEQKFQLVSLPWKRIDYRTFDTEEEALECLKQTVWNSRRAIVTVSSLTSQTRG